MNINSINLDFNFNSDFGDFIFESDYIQVIDRKKEILKNIIVERLKTNFEDIFKYPYYGANIEKYIGQGITPDLVAEIKEKTVNSLIFDNLLELTDINAYTFVKEGILYFRLYINNLFSDPLSVGFTAGKGDFRIDY